MNSDTGQISSNPQVIRSWGSRAVPLTEEQAGVYSRLRKQERLTLHATGELPPAGLTRRERNEWLREHR